MQINASIVWRWTGYHEVRLSEISLRHLTSSDSICRPTLSLAPISIIFDSISVNSHWLESSYQVSSPEKHFKNISLLFIWFGPVCVLVHASWYVRDRHTSRVEPVGPNAGRHPQTTPWGQRLLVWPSRRYFYLAPPWWDFVLVLSCYESNIILSVDNLACTKKLPKRDTIAIGRRELGEWMRSIEGGCSKRTVWWICFGVQLVFHKSNVKNNEFSFLWRTRRLNLCLYLARIWLSSKLSTCWFPSKLRQHAQLAINNTTCM